MNDDSEGFLGRWSRLKQSRRKEADAAPEPDETESALASVPTDASAQGLATTNSQADGDDDGLNLPSIESLDKDSDFSAFLQEGVPEEVQRSALRKLWTSDPVLANLDGLLEYGEDFAAPWRTNTVIKTLYRVGQGMPALLAEADDEEETSTKAADADTKAPDESAVDPMPVGESTDAVVATERPIAADSTQYADEDEKAGNAG